MPRFIDPGDVDGDALYFEADIVPYTAALQVDQSTATAAQKSAAWRSFAQADSKLARLAARRAAEWERFSARLAAWAASQKDMVLIPAGEFVMGSPDGQGEPDEHPRHKVSLDAYFIDKYPVTVRQYKAFAETTGRPMHPRPSWNGEDHPVIYVRWDDAAAYCEWAGKRLPTEAEWEKAARGGSQTMFSFGDDESKIGDYAWYIDNSSGTTHPVGTKKPNQYGLYDMIGNVYEWISDRYGADYYRHSPTHDPQGPGSGGARVLRGGAWGITPYYGRSANRYASAPRVAYDLRGFRCAGR
jgi:formylglycine-generating enzyme required for sulfatase activity